MQRTSLVSSTALLALALGLAPGLLACTDAAEPNDTAADDDTSTTTDNSETGTPDPTGTETSGETGEPDPTQTDADGDGLTDAEEEELGTDPNDVDSDDDSYWDSWELIEGTDPLDYDSRIYVGFWPYNPDKDALEQGAWDKASHAIGSLFPRDVFVDQYGDMVDIYDFSNFTNNTTNTPAFFIIDVAAQWCGPCHNAADWISGVDNANTAPLQDTYPTVREKVEDGRVWWVTFVVQDVNGGAPTFADVETWSGMHEDPKVPIFADARVQTKYGSNQFPFFFLLEPTMAIELWANPGANEDPFFPLSLVDEYL